MTGTETGAIRTTTSGPDGSYALTNLPVGHYQLEVTKEGFSKYVQTGIELQVASNPTIDVALKVGSVSEQVQVEAAAAMVETQSTAVGQVIDSQRVVDLPLIGRQVTDLITLSGAAALGSDTNLNTSRNYSTPTISVAGGLASGTSYVLDGAMHNDPYNNLTLPLPFPDAMQEFKVETSALPAQYGMHSAAVVNAITKSGGNEFHGDAFEFVRNYIFNAQNYFTNAAPGTSKDSLKRNQFGGTFGGPIRKNKLFFFAAFQDTINRQNAVPNVAFEPTPAMLAGNFVPFESAACNGGVAKTLPAPFVNNQISPSLLSTPAVNIVNKLPVTNSQCGSITYGAPNNSNDRQAVGRVDYQLSDKQTLFARYLAEDYIAPVPYDLSGGNLLTTGAATGNSFGSNDLIESFTLGDTYLLGANMVNSLRATFNRTAIARLGASFFDASSVGVNIFSYLPQYMTVTAGPTGGGFVLGTGTSTPASYATTTLQLGDDFSVIHGSHQMAFGAELAHWASNTYANVFSQGNFTFNTLPNFMLGDVTTFVQSTPNELFDREWYFGLYAQDSWKIRPGLSLSYGLRWEPFFPQQYVFGVDHFDLNGFMNGIHSSVFSQAPPGLSYIGDQGFPSHAGMNKQLGDFAPRVGLVWDPKGDGRMSLRASFGEFYDIPDAQYNLNGVVAPPWGGKTTLQGVNFTNPYAGQANPFPLVLNANTPFTPNGSFVTFNYDTQPTQVQSWNFSLQKQLGSDWLLSASYLGSHTIHLPTNQELNPAIYIPGNCVAGQYGLTAAGPCSTTANTNQRRLLSVINPAEGKYFSYTERGDWGGTGSYNGMLLSVQKRLSRNFTFFGNYTWSHCISDPVNTLPNAGAGGVTFENPNDREFDRGDCNTSGTDHRQIFNLTGIAESPKFSDRWMRIFASDWRIAGILTALSGQALTVYTGVDAALNGVATTVQRPNLVLANPYGNGSITNWLNPAAFAEPANGTFGNLGAGSVVGPGAVTLNASLSRIFPIRERQRMEARVEASNLLNHFNPGNPNLAINTGTFGQITTTAAGTGTGFVAPGDPRVMQFVLKYIF